MNRSMIPYILGWVLLCEGALMLLPAAVAVYYGEQAVWAFAVTIVFCALAGGLLIRRKPRDRVFYLRDGFIVTALSWILISVVGAAPFLLSGSSPCCAN